MQLFGMCAEMLAPHQVISFSKIAFQVFPWGLTVIKQTKFSKSPKDEFPDSHSSINSVNMANAFSMIGDKYHHVGTDCPIKLHP